MKVDPAGVVAHLCRAARGSNRLLERYLSDEIVKHIERTDALEEEVERLRKAMQGVAYIVEADDPKDEIADPEWNEAVRKFHRALERVEEEGS